jgi:phosphatidylglycerol:prolipoprotein diacylglycerol transferase
VNLPGANMSVWTVTMSVAEAARAPVSHGPARGVPAYVSLAGSGLIAGILWSAVLQVIIGGRLLTIVATTALGLAACSALTLATRARANRAELVFMHHFAIVLGAAWVAAAITSESVLGSLDVVGAGMLVMLSLGRIGCHVSGCCHGRPTKRGVVYAPAGFAFGRQAFAGIPLAPVQLIESIAAAALAVTASAIVVADSQRGAALTVTLIGYGALRLATEAWRGDRGRRGITAAHGAIATALVFCIVGVALATRSSPGAAFAAALVALAALGYHVAVAGTRLGADDLLLAASLARNSARGLGSPDPVTGNSGISFLVTGPPERLGVRVAAEPSLSHRDIGRLRRTIDLVAAVANPDSTSVEVTQERRTP